MKIHKKIIRRYNEHRKSKKVLLGFSLLELSILSLLIVGGSAAAYYRYEHAQKTLVTTAAAKSSRSETLCVTGEADCPDTQTPATPKASSTASSATTPKKGESCIQIEATFGPILTEGLASAWTTASSFTYDTTAGINYAYNQSATFDYNEYTQGMEEFGCTPVIPSPALKYPATAPSSTSTPAYTAPTPSCNTSQEAVYEQDYVTQENADKQSASEQDQSLEAELGAAGSGDSSALQEGEASINNQLTSEIDALQQTLNNELVSIDCPTT